MGAYFEAVLTNATTMLRTAYVLFRAALFSLSVLPATTCAQRDVPATVRGHALVFQRIDGGLSQLSTRRLPTDGNTVTIVSVGRGDIRAFELPAAKPSGLSFNQLGETHPYTKYQNSGTALYAALASTDDAKRVIHAVTPPADEITLAAVVVSGQRIQDVTWSEVLAGTPVTSGQVTTTGPATLVAFWWGDAGVRYEKQAVPSAGYTVVDSVLASGALVQCAVAVRRVTEAGTYDVTWRAFPTQGAQMWLVAIE